MLHSRHIFNAMNYMQLIGKFVPLGERDPRMCQYKKTIKLMESHKIKIKAIATGSYILM